MNELPSSIGMKNARRRYLKVRNELHWTKNREKKSLFPLSPSSKVSQQANQLVRSCVNASDRDITVVRTDDFRETDREASGEFGVAVILLYSSPTLPLLI